MSTRFSVALIVLLAIVVCVSAYLHRNDPYSPAKVKHFDGQCWNLAEQLRLHPRSPSMVWVQYQANYDSLMQYYNVAIPPSANFQTAKSLYWEAREDSIRGIGQQKEKQ